MRIAGIDISTHAIDIVTINLDGPHQPDWRRADLEKTKTDTSWATVGRVKQAMTQADLLGSYWDNIAQVYYEDPFSFGASVAKSLGLITGATRACLPDRLQDRCERLRPTEWRQLVELKGDATKEAVAAHAIYLMGAPDFGPDWPQDAFDAYLIALAGRNLCHKAAA